MENINVNEAMSEIGNVINNRNEDKYGDIYSKYAAIYLAPTSNVKDTINLFDTNNIDTSLVVLGSGAYVFELLLKGVKEIDAFDINVLQYFYYELLKSAIKSLDYEDFTESFTAKSLGSGIRQDMSGMFKSYTIFDILGEIDEPARSFWMMLFRDNKHSLNRLLPTNLFRGCYKLYPSYLTEFSSVYNEEDFYNLQNILIDNDYNINYKIAEIQDIPDMFNDKKYDLIMFDNILQYYKKIPKLNDIYKVNNFIKNDVSNMLTDNGVIQAAYGFEVTSNALCKVINRKIPNMTIADMFLLEMSKEYINKEKKEGIISNFARKYNDYSSYFIPGVETDPFLGHYSENVVLTYKKNHK